jgi:hypothetical protein
VPFDGASGDRLMEDVNPALAAELRSAFLVPFGDMTAGEDALEDTRPEIVIYIRPPSGELRIEGPGPTDEWWSAPWDGEAESALTFAEDAGFAAGGSALGRIHRWDGDSVSGPEE